MLEDKFPDVTIINETPTLDKVYVITELIQVYCDEAAEKEIIRKITFIKEKESRIMDSVEEIKVNPK